MKRKILIIDDDEDLSMIISDMLTDHGYECTPADIRPEREIGKPVKGFERRVPLSWIEKGFVEVLDEHREEPF